MKRFRYSLQALRSVREREEQLAIEEYARVSLQHRQAVGLLTEANGQVEAARTEIRSKLCHGTSGAEFMRLQTGFVVLDQRRRSCEQVVAGSLAALTRASDKLAQARKQKEIVEKHHNFQKERHAQATRMEELKFLDELATRQAATDNDLQLGTIRARG